MSHSIVWRLQELLYTSVMSTITLPAAAYNVLRRYWGYEEFRPLQAAAISSVLQQRDSVTILATGAGKSICYQLPALVLPGTAVVVSPLISLMKDQVDGLVANGISAAFVNSSQSYDEKRRIAGAVRAGEIKLLYVAPERLCTQQTMDFLADCEISFFAIDEAHCISAWGHDFRPDYRELSRLKARFPDKGVHAYTATATQQVRDDIARQLTLKESTLHIGSFDRPNLNYQIQPRENLNEQIEEVVKRHRKASGVIYCLSRKKTEDLAAWLKSRGYRAKCYHAGLTDLQRKKAQEQFQQQKIDIIVGTVAFGMGIDKSDVRYVIHTGMPRSLENYQQESGRAGRDSLPAECWLFHGRGDVVVWKKMLSDLPADAYEIAMSNLQSMEGFCQSLECRHRTLLEHFGQTYDQPSCQACDSCLTDRKVIEDPLINAQKVISCVYRLKEQFGVGHTVRVLTGSREKRIIELKHDELSTYGLLKEIGRDTVKSWIEQLIGQQCLEVVGEYLQLKITTKGREILKGLWTPMLTESKSAPARQSSSLVEMSDVEKELFEQLREFRYDLAGEKGVPPYLIFTDSVLVQMCLQRPVTRELLSGLSGVGAKKLEQFGDEFLKVIVEFCQEHKLNASPAPPPKALKTVQQSHKEPGLTMSPRAVEAREMFGLGRTVDEVALQLDVATTTACKYLEEYLTISNDYDIHVWVSESMLTKVKRVCEELGSAPLNPIFESLDGRVSYEEIRIVIAHLNSQKKSNASLEQSHG